MHHFQKIFSCLLLALGVSANADIANTTECGGVLTGNQGMIEYKLNTNYSAFERCHWTVRVLNQAGIQLTLSPISLGNTGGYITVHKVNHSGLYEELSITGDTNSSQTIQVTSGAALVSFYSNGEVESQGFSISWEAVGGVDVDVAYHEDFTFVAEPSKKVFRYPATENETYHDKELSTFVVSRPTGSNDSDVNLNITMIYLQSAPIVTCLDKLHIYATVGLANFHSLLRITERPGVCTEGGIPVIPHAGSVVMILSTDDSYQGYGFQVEWDLVNK